MSSLDWIHFLDKTSDTRERFNEHIANRLGPRFLENSNKRPIAEHAALRYFTLLEDAQDSLVDRFSEQEFGIILNSVPQYVWGWDGSTSVAVIVANAHGRESTEQDRGSSPLATLLGKLNRLSPLENAVLVDVCERVWRGQDNPLL